MKHIEPPSAEEKWKQRLEAARQRLGIHGPDNPHPSTALFRSKLAQKGAAKPERPKLRLKRRKLAPRVPPKPRPVKLRPLPPIDIPHTWLNIRLTPRRVVERCAFGSVEQLLAYVRNGWFPQPIHRDCKPDDLRWSLIAILTHEAWGDRSIKVEARRRKHGDLFAEIEAPDNLVQIQSKGSLTTASRGNQNV